MKEKLKNKKGITLVALIITVIILLILAGVTISLLIGDNGMVKKTKQGVEESEMASIKEQAELVRNEQGIRNFEGNPQELTKSSYINALNVSFENSIVEGSRVIVKDKKYAIFVKSNLEIEVIKNDGKTLAEGEMKLDYTVSEDGLIEIYPRIGGVESYKTYAEKILEGKTQGEKEQIFVDGDKYRYPEDYENIENPTIEDLMKIRGFSKKEDLINFITYGGNVSFDEALVNWQYVKPEGYDFDTEIEIICPDNQKLKTDTNTLSIKYFVYKNGEYEFVGNIVKGKYSGLSANTVVSVNLDENVYEYSKIKLRINVTDDNKIIQLPTGDKDSDTQEEYKYNCEVDWGDSTEKQKVTKGSYTGLKHEYVNSGEYTITIEGAYESLYVNEDNDSMKKALIKVEQWGTTGLKDIYLEKCANLTEIASPSKNSFVKITSFRSAFSECSSLTNIPENLFANCPSVIDFSYTFHMCEKLEGKSIHLWEEGREGINEENGGFGCYTGCYNLEDYEEIPRFWKSFDK